MRVERRRAASGREGWTVTWKGRGWDRSFDDYLALVRAAGDLTRAGEHGRRSVGQISSAPARTSRFASRSTATRPSASPPPGAATSCRWKRISRRRWPAMRSPTSRRGSSAGCAKCRRRFEPATPAPVRLALKLMNARFDDAFQLAMLRGRPARRRCARRLQSAVGCRRAALRTAATI